MGKVDRNDGPVKRQWWLETPQQALIFGGGS